jgi:hypothetical protein
MKRQEFPGQLCVYAISPLGYKQIGFECLIGRFVNWDLFDILSLAHTNRHQLGLSAGQF